MNKKAIALYSGGLDSLLAAKIAMEQGIDVIGLHCVLLSVDPQLPPESLPASQSAQQIGLPLVYYRCDEQYVNIVASPKHGYGKRVNPCIDCKIFFLEKAKEYMKTMDASFVITGEVVGQRPMSQYKSMLRHIEKESGLEGLLLRPLSAKLLPPTIPEQQGIISRDKCHAISGRSRNQQMLLAQKYGIARFQSPAGGCFLTMPALAPRVRDVLAHPPFTPVDIYLATVGRHYRLNDNAVLIVARNQNECMVLDRYKNDAPFYAEPSFIGPVICGRGAITSNDYTMLAQIMARYGKPTADENSVALFIQGQYHATLIASTPVDDARLSAMRI